MKAEDVMYMSEIRCCSGKPGRQCERKFVVAYDKKDNIIKPRGWTIKGWYRCPQHKARK